MHPSTSQLLARFNYGHLPEGEPRDVSARFHRLAHELVVFLPEGPEKTVTLRKLLESKDAAVRCALGDMEPEPIVDGAGEELPGLVRVDTATLYGQREPAGPCPICGAGPGQAHDGARHDQHEKAGQVADTASPRGKQ